MFKNFLTVAWRNILRHKRYTAIHVIGLGVGICACMAIWAITHYELSFDKFHPDRDRIYRVVTETALETVAQFHNINPMVSIPGEHGQVTLIPKAVGNRFNDVVLAEPEYFEIFKYQWLAGDPSTLKEPFHVVLEGVEGGVPRGAVPIHMGG